MPSRRDEEQRHERQREAPLVVAGAACAAERAPGGGQHDGLSGDAGFELVDGAAGQLQRRGEDLGHLVEVELDPDADLGRASCRVADACGGAEVGVPAAGAPERARGVVDSAWTREYTLQSALPTGAVVLGRARARQAAGGLSAMTCVTR